MIGTKVFGRTSILVGWWMILHFFKAFISPSSRCSIHPFLQNLLVENSYSAVRNGRNSVPQTEVTTFAFSNVFIFPGLGIRLKTSYSTVDKQGGEKAKGQKWQSKSEENPNYEFYTESVSYFKRVQFIRDIWYKVQYSIKSWKWIKLEFLSSKICATSKGNTIRNRNSQFHLLYYEILDLVRLNFCSLKLLYTVQLLIFFTTFEFKNLVRL